MTTRIKRAWIVVGSIMAIASLGWAGFNVASLLAWDRQTFATTFAESELAGVRTVDISNDAGAVRVIGTDGDGIAVDGEIVQGFQDASHEERVEGDRVVLQADCPIDLSYCKVDYEVQVPRGVAVRVRADGGPVRVSGVDGDLELASSGGGVRVEDARGDLVLRSSGGGVRGSGLTSGSVDAESSGGGVRLQFIEAPRTVRAASNDGGVTVVVPDDPRAFYALDTSSSDGGVRTDIRSDPTSDRTISARSSDGGVVVRYPE